ncbi:unnamed protein product [Linum tenue]|uniref:Uncharacterized protein n=1 Tax=Linum tenue TaxID=586396 RepID=A0AAV0N4P9_9ROSI|nr:unnamed protein product [Linum tenue]
MLVSFSGASIGSEVMDAIPGAPGSSAAVPGLQRFRRRHSPGDEDREGVLFDHTIGLVVGETPVIGNNVSIMYLVTLNAARIEERIRNRFAIRRGDLVSPLEVLEPQPPSEPEPVVRTRKRRAERAKMRPSQDLVVVDLETTKS